MCLIYITIIFQLKRWFLCLKKCGKISLLAIFLYLFIYKQPGNKNYNKFILRFSPRLLPKRFKKYFSILFKSFNDFATS